MHARIPALVFLAALTSYVPHAVAQETAAPGGTTAPTASLPATGASAPSTDAAAPSGLESVEDFGQVDLEMAIVSDFSEFNLEDLLNTQVETASKKKESISRAPAIIEVMTRKQLYDLGARDLYTALTYLPGIELIENYSGTTTLIFRGMFSEQYSVKLLLLVNGHPVYEPISSQFQLEAIPLESIKRIEVIRGPGSVLYGTNAFAGVINIITETAQEGEVKTLLRGEAGQFTTFSGGAGNTGRIGEFHWSLFAGGQKTRGYPYRILKTENEDCTVVDEQGTPAGLPPSELDPYACNRPGKYSGTLEYFNNYVNAYGSVGYKGLRLQAGGNIQEKQKFGILPSLRYSGPNNITHYYADLSYQHEWDTVSLIARAGLNHDDLAWEMGVFPLPVVPFEQTHAEGNTDLYRVEIGTSWQIVEPLRFDTGVSYDYGDLSSFLFLEEDGDQHPLAPEFNDYTLSTASWFGQLTWDIVEELTVIAGYRASQFETDRTQVTIDEVSKTPIYERVDEDPILIHSPRGGLVYIPREDLTFKLLYGEAFRLPNVFETAGALNNIIAPTEGIKPETIRTAELGVDSRPHERLSLRANVYYSKLYNLITRRPPVNAEELLIMGGAIRGGMYDNVFDGTIYGAELGTQAYFTEALSAFANISWKTSQYEPIEPDYKQAGGNLRAPKPAPVLANAGISWRAANWLALRPNAQYVGPRGYAKAYTLVNAVVDFPVTESITLSAIGNNLLDQEYRYPEPVRLYVPTTPGGPGRAFYGRITAEF